jgi:hypothetical protein
VTKALLTIHVIVAIIAFGPMTVAASMFPAMTRRVADSGEGNLVLLHRICRVYALIGILVPFFGLATAGAMHVIGSPWLIASMILTASAAITMGAVIIPRQKHILGLAAEEHVRVDRALPARLAMYTGLFNLLWVAVTVLMIVRPGSSTGA